MKCPKCRSKRNKVPVTNGRLADQIVRQRVCVDCGHKWFTAELAVPSYAVGWSATGGGKPVLRVPVELQATHAELRVTDCDSPDA